MCAWRKRRATARPASSSTRIRAVRRLMSRSPARWSTGRSSTEPMVAAHDLTQEPAGNRGLNPDIDRKLLTRAEDAGLNASAPPQQLWLDGWLVRFSPGKAKRARCINALAGGRLSVGHKL